MDERTVAITLNRATRASNLDETAAVAKGAPAGDAAWPSTGYAWYVAAVLTLAYTLSFIDRQILGLVLEPIRRDMGLTDTQVSLLAGTAFALFYVCLGLPLGRLADRANRRYLIFVGVLLWSLMTAVCGFSTTFWQLFAARVGVGIGEAALTPAAHSIISDYFPVERRVRPLAMYNLALAVGAGLAYLLGGAISAAVSNAPEFVIPFIGAVRGWQVTFIAVGAPGILFALLILSIREPQRRGLRPASEPQSTAAHPGITRVRDVWSFIWHENPQTFVALFFAFGGFAVFADAILTWMPTVFVRRFGWSADRIGLSMGAVILPSATLGVLASMTLASHVQSRGNPGALLSAATRIGFALTPIGILLPLADTPTLALVLLAPTAALTFGLYALVPPILQLITPNQMRGQVVALFALFNNVMSLMLGATCVGLLTDHLFRNSGLLYRSLAMVAALVLPLSALLMRWGVPYFGRSIVAAKSWIANVG
jgi:MFS family permease